MNFTLKSLLLLFIFLIVSCNSEEPNYFPFEENRYQKFMSFEAEDFENYKTYQQLDNDLKLQLKEVSDGLYRIDLQIDNIFPVPTPLTYFQRSDKKILFSEISYFESDLIYELDLPLPEKLRWAIGTFEIEFLGIEDHKFFKEELPKCAVFELESHFLKFRVWFADGLGVVKIRKYETGNSKEIIWILNDFVK